MKVPDTMFIGEPGRAFERVCLAFQAYGFEPPMPDEITGGTAHGAYVSNILPQYTDTLPLLRACHNPAMNV